jgi:hypothetical protein
MSSASSTERDGAGKDTGFQPWHFYMLLSLAGATWAVIVARDTHPAALVLLSGAIVAAGLVGAAVHASIAGFFSSQFTDHTTVSARTREFLEQEKALVLRSIKELEFDRAMRKISDQDFAEIGGRLRARAMEIMQALDGSSVTPGAPSAAPRPQAQAQDDGAPSSTPGPRSCSACRSVNDRDARFCKNCGAML